LLRKLLPDGSCASALWIYSVNESDHIGLCLRRSLHESLFCIFFGKGSKSAEFSFIVEYCVTSLDSLLAVFGWQAGKKHSVPET
jgi:hypothetical protein